MDRTARTGATVAALALVAAAAHASFANLGDPAWATDEPVYRNAARAIGAFGNWSHNLEHPPLGKLLVVASEWALGSEPWATRIVAPVSVLLAGALLGLLAARMLRGALGTGARVAAALATFATWTLLPHPVPAFDVSRLAYLDAPMLLFVSAALYVGWRWQEGLSRRWGLATGVLAGCAVAVKFPALFLAAVLVVPLVRRGAPGVGRRLASYGIVVGTAAAVAVAWWLPLGGDLPAAWRFAAAMQLRDTDQQLRLAGRTFDGAPWWTQAWWQWDAWPAFALVQLAVVAAAWWVLPRRVAAWLLAATVLPAAAYAVSGGRILPHWMATWQPGMAVLVGTVATVLVVAPHRARALRVASVGAGALVLAVVAGHAVERSRSVASLERSPAMAVQHVLEPADRPGTVVVDVADRIDVAPLLSMARPHPWDGRYHSAAENQHDWVERAGGRPLEPEPSGGGGLERLRAGAVSAIVADLDREDELPFAEHVLHERYERVEVGEFVVWMSLGLR